MVLIWLCLGSNDREAVWSDNIISKAVKIENLRPYSLKVHWKVREETFLLEYVAVSADCI